MTFVLPDLKQTETLGIIKSRDELPDFFLFSSGLTSNKNERQKRKNRITGRIDFVLYVAGECKERRFFRFFSTAKGRKTVQIQKDQ